MKAVMLFLIEALVILGMVMLIVYLFGGFNENECSPEYIAGLHDRIEYLQDENIEMLKYIKQAEEVMSLQEEMINIQVNILELRGIKLPKLENIALPKFLNEGEEHEEAAKHIKIIK